MGNNNNNSNKRSGEWKKKTLDIFRKKIENNNISFNETGELQQRN
jgi:hypothetical protein